MKRTRGFTLVELVVVMVLIGIVGAILVLQVRPAMQAYLAVGRRANLTAQADTALRRIIADAHAAVPNSLRLASNGSTQCLEMVPTTDGGRFRTAPDFKDPAKPAGTGAALVAGGGATFDVLTTLTTTRVNDDVVIDNESAATVYAGSNRARITAIGAAVAGQAQAQLTLAANPLPAGYEGGRFVVVPQEEPAVTYVCVPGANGNAGYVQRVTGYTPTAAQACPQAGPTAAYLVRKVKDCGFLYNVNEGATQESGYVQVRLNLADGDEGAAITMGAHVENVP